MVKTMGELAPGTRCRDAAGRELEVVGFHASHHDNVVVTKGVVDGRRYEYAARADAHVEEPA